MAKIKSAVASGSKTGGKKRRYIIWGGLAVAVLVLVLVSQSMPLPVYILTLQPADFSRGFTEEGEIVAASEWPVFSPLDGRIKAIRVENGVLVQKGQILFELNTDDINYTLAGLRAQIQSLEGQWLQNSGSPNAALVAQQNLRIEQAEKDLRAEENNLARQQALYEAGALSLSQYEEARDAASRAGNILEQERYGLKLLYEQNQGADMYFANQIKALQAQVAQAEDRLGKAGVTAPRDGVVKDLFLKEGNVVAVGQQVMTVFAEDGYKIESYVLAGDVPDIRIGDKAEVVQSAGSGNRYFAGQVEAVEIAAVERISPLGLKENRVKVTIRLSDVAIPLVLGSTADVRFITFAARNQLLLPKTAVFPYQDGAAVWIVQEGKAYIRPVKKGLENDRQVLIEEGLREGDRVIREPNIAGLKEGKRVKEAK